MDDIETQRLANLKAHGTLNGDPRPGSFCCHEALHMASYFTSAIDAELCNHPAIMTNPEWFRLATEAQDKLAELYGAIGEAHLSAEEDCSHLSGEEMGQRFIEAWQKAEWENGHDQPHPSPRHRRGDR